MKIFSFISQLEAIVVHWPWWAPGAIGVSIVLLPLILFSPLQKFQKFYDFIAEGFFIIACYEFIALYVIYALVHFDKFLAGVAVIIALLLSFLFTGFLIFAGLIAISNHFTDKRDKRHQEHMKMLRDLGKQAEKGDMWS